MAPSESLFVLDPQHQNEKMWSIATPKPQEAQLNLLLEAEPPSQARLRSADLQVTWRHMRNKSLLDYATKILQLFHSKS